MMRRHLPAVLAGAVALLLGPVAAFAQERLHGADSTFRSADVTIGWGVLKGRDEDTTYVVLRVIPRTGAYQRVSVEGVDPFTQTRTRLVDGQMLAQGAPTDLRSPRAGFADAPSRELHFYADATAWQANRPVVTIFYLGVPDTTPEFTSQAALDAYLRDSTR
jgi:hypothetical protein